MQIRDAKRIGNVGARRMADYEYKYEIVLYYPNPFYGKESEYIQSDKPEFLCKPSATGAYIRTTGSYIHKDCFINPESCYVVARISNDDDPDVRSVGLRPWDLEEQDKKDFEQVIRWCTKEDAVSADLTEED